MRYEAFIFDLDGTLLDTLEDLKNSVNAALKTYHMPVRTLEEVRNFVGNGIGKLIERAAPEGTPAVVQKQVLNDFKEHYRVHCMDCTRPYPGVMDMLDECRRRGIEMAVVSNKADFAVQELRERFFSGRIRLAMGETTQVRKKPAADMVKKILCQWDLEKEKIAYVGDSEVDIVTAENAGLDFIGVSWGFRGRDFLKKRGARRIVDSPEELFNCE